MQIYAAELGELHPMMVMQLREVYPPQEAAAMAKALLMHITGLSPGEMVLEKKRRLSESEINFLQRAVKRLKRHEPLQYITGSAFFHGYEFHVAPGVLIPRPETEELLDWVISEYGHQNKKLDVLDIGTGSGCIAISLKKKIPRANLHAIDLSQEALETARANADRLEAEVYFENLDILDEDARGMLGRYDIIVSNPPYVTPGDQQEMDANVLDHEPDLALFVSEDDPLRFYREIISFGLIHLNPGGKIFFECNERSADEVAELLDAIGYEQVLLRRDMQGKDRLVYGIKPESGF